MDKTQKKAVKRCFNAVSALIQERKDINEQVTEEFKTTSDATGWRVNLLKYGYSLFKKGVTLDDIHEFYEVFEEMDNNFTTEDEE